MESTPRTTTAVVIGGAVFGLAVRVALLHGNLGRATSDDAVVGLMARHLLHGRDLTVFYWGQSYGGTQESMLTAATFAVFGSTTVALKSVTIALHAASAVVLWRAARRAVDETAARIAAVVWWVFPAADVWWSTQSRGFYGVTLLIGLFAILGAQRLVEAPEPRRAVTFGFALGFGAWASPQIAYLGLPALVWALARGRTIVRQVGFVVGGAVVGAGPWIYDHLVHHHSPWDSVVGIPGITFTDRFGDFWRGVPQSLGIQVPFSHRWLVPGGPVIGPFVVALGVIAVIAAGRKSHQPALEPFLIAAVIYPVLFAWSPLSVSPDLVRYFYFVGPIVALGLGWLLTRDLRMLGAGGLALLALTSLGLVRLDRFGSRPECWPELAPPDLAPLVRELDDRHIHTLVADYWLAFRITFETKERIVATPSERPRYLPYYRTVRRDGGFATYAFLANDGAPERFFRTRLRELRIESHMTRVGRVDLYVLERPVDPAKVTYALSALLSKSCGGS